VLLAVVLCVPWCPALNPSFGIEQYNCQTWGRESGLPALGIRAITQGEDGYLWFGTQTGLVRFDGVQFTRFTLPSGGAFRSEVIASIVPARGGGVWFGVGNGALGFCDDDGRVTSAADIGWMHPGNTVTAIHSNPDGTILVATDEGLGQYVTADPPRSTFDRQRPTVRSIHEDPQHRVWLVTTNDGVWYRDNGEWRRFPDDSLRQDQPSVAVADREGRVWVGTNVGLRCYGPDFKRRQIPGFTQDVKDLLVDHLGTLWVATSGDGVACFRQGAFSYFRKTDGLADNAVNTLFEDREGSLWVGTRRGLSQLSDVKFPIYSAPQGLVGGPCHGVSSSPRGGVWVATSEGVSYFDGREARNYTTANGLSNPYVKRAFEARDGLVYLMNGRMGLDVLAGDRVIATFRGDTWPTAFTEDARGVIVSIGGALYRLNRAGLTPYLVGDQAAPKFTWIRNLFTSRDGSLWVATVNGVERFKDGVAQHLSISTGALENDIYDICEDEEGGIWAATAAGIVRITGDHLVSVGERRGLPDELLYAVVPDGAGHLWVNSSRGIFAVSLRDLNAVCDGRAAQVTATSYNGPNAVKTIDSTEVEYVGCRTPDGRIWFPTPLGAVAIDPAHIPASTIVPPVRIQRIAVAGLNVPVHGPLVLPPDAHELEIEYAALSFVAPQSLRFRYRLEGFARGWVEVSGRRAVHYTNLSPGRYVFRVQAANADGRWNVTGDSIAIVLQPHFYQTGWFLVLCGAITVSGIAALYARRARRLRREQHAREEYRQRLETEVRNRTQELQRENADRRRAEEALRVSEAFLQSLLENLPLAVVRKDRDGRITFANAAYCLRHRVSPESVVGQTSADHMSPADAQRQRESDQQVVESGRSYDAIETFTPTDGTVSHGRVLKVPVFGADGRTITGSQAMILDVTEQKEAEERLEQLNRKLRETSREAGMAEVATGVLHNVGNVLNSVNVSATLISDHVRHSKISNVAKVSTLLQQHTNDLAEFLTTDPRGRMVPGYIASLGELLEQERTGILGELEQLRKNIEHIKEIVAMQQSYARTSGVMETVSVPDMIEDALRMNAGSLARHEVDTVRDYRARPVITTDKHKVMQILINLVRNAKYACDESGRTDKLITVTTTASDGWVRIAVSDNGVGIVPENLTRIFAHGFTTRKHGHGFGLHSGALAAKELGGSLTVESAGLGKGATFVLQLPYKRENHDHDSFVT
jgi:PAS domain S-box-containing protein